MKRRLFLAVRRDRTMTADDLKRHFDLDVSKWTIYKALKEKGLISAYKTRKPFLSTENKRKRLA